MMQSPVLRLVLFMIFINDFDEDMFIKLAVDTSLGGIANMISVLICVKKILIVKNDAPEITQWKIVKLNIKSSN